MLNKCQPENAASLFKSIRGLGLTVSGGRSPLLWGWGDFFFLPKFFQSQSGDIVTSNFLLSQQLKNMKICLNVIKQHTSKLCSFEVKQNRHTRSDKMLQLI